MCVCVCVRVCVHAHARVCVRGLTTALLGVGGCDGRMRVRVHVRVHVRFRARKRAQVEQLYSHKSGMYDRCGAYRVIFRLGRPTSRLVVEWGGEC